MASFHSSNKDLDTKEMDDTQGGTYIHKVGVPPKQKLFKEFMNTVKETFFSDDPLRSFKHQSKSRKLILGMQAVFPILEWGRNYNLVNFRGDLIAGLTIASLCIPQDIGYSKLANLAPQYGLYSSFVPPLIYAVMGSSRDIAIGPVAVVSLLLGTLLQNEIDPTTNPEDYLRLAFTATFFAGITQATLGILRMGFLIDFLSHAAIVGFMGGAAITIALQQLKGFLGIKKFTKKTDIISVMDSVFSSAQNGLVLANPGPVVIDKLHASHVANLIGEDRIFLTVAEAVSSCRVVCCKNLLIVLTVVEDTAGRICHPRQPNW